MQVREARELIQRYKIIYALYISLFRCKFFLSNYLVFTVIVLGQDEGYTVKYDPLSEGVPSGFALGNS